MTPAETSKTLKHDYISSNVWEFDFLDKNTLR